MSRTRLKGAERRERFLDAAAQIVIEQGVAAVTMDGVAALTGVNKALGYRYFSDRDDLLTALFDRETKIYVERLASEVGPTSSFEDWVRGALKYWCRRADERGELFMRLVRDCGPLAERARANRQADAEGWALGLQKAFGLPARQAKQYAWFMVAGTAGALDARDGDDEAMIEAITLAVVAGAKALAKKYGPPRPANVSDRGVRDASDVQQPADRSTVQ